MRAVKEGLGEVKTVPVVAWGHLKLLKRGKDPIELKGPNGPYSTGELGPSWMLLECLCGTQIKVFVRDFPGRKMLRDCGRLNCPARGLPDWRDPNKHELSKIHSLYLPPSLVSRLRAYVQTHKLQSVSQAARVLMSAQLDYEDEQRKSPNRETHETRNVQSASVSSVRGSRRPNTR